VAFKYIAAGHPDVAITFVPEVFIAVTKTRHYVSTKFPDFIFGVYNTNE